MVATLRSLRCTSQRPCCTRLMNLVMVRPSCTMDSLLARMWGSTSRTEENDAGERNGLRMLQSRNFTGMTLPPHCGGLGDCGPLVNAKRHPEGMGIHIGCCNCVERGLLRTAPTRSCLTTQQLTLFSWWLPRLLDTQVKTRQNISPSVGEHGNSSYLLLRYPTTKPIPSLGARPSLYSTLQSCPYEDNR